MADIVAPENLLQKFAGVFKRKGNTASQGPEVRYIAPPDRKEITKEQKKSR